MQERGEGGSKEWNGAFIDLILSSHCRHSLTMAQVSGDQIDLSILAQSALPPVRVLHVTCTSIVCTLAKVLVESRRCFAALHQEEGDDGTFSQAVHPIS